MKADEYEALGQRTDLSLAERLEEGDAYLLTPHAYAIGRKNLGSQAEAARLLGVHPTTLSRRENGRLPVTREQALAIWALAMLQEWA